MAILFSVMRYSQLFSKASKTSPSDADSINARLLQQAGFVRQEMAGVYSWLPLGLRVLRKVEAIVREEMQAIGAVEVMMPNLHPKEYWTTTGRWNSVDVLFKVPSQTKKEYALAPSAEEVVTPLMQQFVQSYKQLPVAAYQIHEKFRDELRAKSGVLRGREFVMKDLYSFHATQKDLDLFYAKVTKAYLTLFTRCGVEAKVVEASGGVFSEKFSHEFHVETAAGEDKLLMCPSCTFAQNSEVATLKEGDACPTCGGSLRLTKGIEVGNIYDLGTKYSDAFTFTILREDGTRGQVFMGCYGIGVTRLIGAVVEASHDERGMIWPASIAPFRVHLIALRSKDAAVQSRLDQLTEEMYAKLGAQGVEVLWDDRGDASAGERLADADLIGLPIRLLFSEKTLKENSVEWKSRSNAETRLIKIEDILDTVSKESQY